MTIGDVIDWFPWLMWSLLTKKRFWNQKWRHQSTSFAKEIYFGKFQIHSMFLGLRNREVVLKCQIIGLQNLTTFQNESLVDTQKLQSSVVLI